MRTALSPGERAEFERLFAPRLEKVKARTDDVFSFKKTSEPPYIVNAAPYWAFGTLPESFPDGYYDDPAVMTRFQERSYYEQICAVDDDFVPYLMPWFGTAVTASAFGCTVDFPDKMDPAVNPHHYPVQNADDVRRLEIPDFEKAGLMPRVLKFIRYMREHSFLPVGITDFQGPLTTANQLMGYDKLIYLMQDHPSVMHALMEVVTETLIGWARKQKEVIGEPLNECISDQQVYVGRHAGIWFSDDDAVLMSPHTYREFVVPYNSRILRAFGGGCLHYCGDATHQAENFLATEGLVAINNYTLHGIRAFRELKSKLEGKIVLFACDFTPLDYGRYFQELLGDMSLSGLVIDSQFTAAVALTSSGKYEQARRNPQIDRKKVFDDLRQHLALRQAA